MKNQYFGDVNDYKKYGLLRELLRGSSGELAVGWTLTADDSRSDGSRIRYLEDPGRWRAHDPVLFDFLREQVLEDGTRSVSVLEESSTLPNCRFFPLLLLDDLGSRESYFQQFFRFAEGAEMVFFDPDNGLGITKVERGKRGSSKYVYPSEVAAAWRLGHSVLFYQHFPRQSRGPFLGRLLSVLRDLPDLRKVLFFVTSHVVFVLLPSPRHEARLVESAGRIRDRWGDVVRVQIRNLRRPVGQRPMTFSDVPRPARVGT